MKMKTIDRILIALYALMGALALVVVGIGVVAPDTAVNLGYAMQAVMNNSITVQILSVLLVIVLIAWSVRLIMLAFRPEGSAPSSSAAVQESVDGAVRVSVRAMETLVRRAVVQTDGILDSKLRINNHDDSVSVEIDMVVGIEAHVPAVTALLQRNVKGIVEEFSGIAVREVKVLVTEIRDNAPPALPAPKDESVQAVVVEPEKVEIRHEEPVPAAEEPAAEEPAAEEPAEANAEETAEEAAGACEEAAEESAAEPAAEEAAAEKAADEADKEA